VFRDAEVKEAAQRAIKKIQAREGGGDYGALTMFGEEETAGALAEVVEKGRLAEVDAED